MKTFKIMGIVALSIITLSSCVKLGNLNLEPVPDIAFTVAHSGLTLTFTSSVDNTSNISWTTSDGGSGTGDALTHTFPEPDTYWVQMTGTYNGTPQTVSAKILVAKPALVSMTDGTVADWDNVQYEDFMFLGEEPGESPIVIGKLDYDANWIYFYMEMDVTKNEGCTDETHIMSIKVDSDDDPSTGMSTSGIGAEYLMEGHLYGEEPWYDFYSYDAAADDWAWIEDPTFAGEGLVIGHYEMDGDIMKIEWAYSRQKFQITSTSVSLAEKIYDEDWNDADIFYQDGSKALHIMMDKKQ